MSVFRVAALFLIVIPSAPRAPRPGTEGPSCSSPRQHPRPLQGTVCAGSRGRQTPFLHHPGLMEWECKGWSRQWRGTPLGPFWRRYRWNPLARRRSWPWRTTSTYEAGATTPVGADILTFPADPGPFGFLRSVADIGDVGVAGYMAGAGCSDFREAWVAGSWWSRGSGPCEPPRVLVDVGVALCRARRPSGRGTEPRAGPFL